MHKRVVAGSSPAHLNERILPLLGLMAVHSSSQEKGLRVQPAAADAICRGQVSENAREESQPQTAALDVRFSK